MQNKNKIVKSKKNCGQEILEIKMSNYKKWKTI